MKEKRSAVCPLIGSVLVINLRDVETNYRLCCILRVILPVRSSSTGGGGGGSELMVRVFDGYQVRRFLLLCGLPPLPCSAVLSFDTSYYTV